MHYRFELVPFFLSPPQSFVFLPPPHLAIQQHPKLLCRATLRSSPSAASSLPLPNLNKSCLVLPVQCPPPGGNCSTMATIEPRLIHLLNNSQTPHLPPIPDRLPPVDAAASGLPLFIPPINQSIGDEGHPAPAARPENDFSTDSAGRLTGPGRPLQLLLAGPETNMSTFLPRMWTPPPFDDASTRREQRAAGAG